MTKIVDPNLGQDVNAELAFDQSCHAAVDASEKDHGIGTDDTSNSPTNIRSSMPQKTPQEQNEWTSNSGICATWSILNGGGERRMLKERDGAWQAGGVRRGDTVGLDV